MATALEIYVKGSLNLFNHRTNVDIQNRLVCYDIKELGKQLKKIGVNPVTIEARAGISFLPSVPQLINLGIIPQFEKCISA